MCSAGSPTTRSPGPTSCSPGVTLRPYLFRADCAAVGGASWAVGRSGPIEQTGGRPMPRAYSTDLRERVLAAYGAGEGGQATVARRCRVGERTLSRWLRADREEGRREPKVPARGRVPIGGAGAALAELVAEQSDATLAEYADRLAARAGIRRSLSAVCRALKSLGLVRKKRRSGPPSRTAGTWSRRGRAGAPSWPGSTPAAWSSSTRPGSTPGWRGPTPAPRGGDGRSGRCRGAVGSG